jgi:hypothetical protein
MGITSVEAGWIKETLLPNGGIPIFYLLCQIWVVPIPQGWRVGLKRHPAVVKQQRKYGLEVPG